VFAHVAVARSPASFDHLSCFVSFKAGDIVRCKARVDGALISDLGGSKGKLTCLLFVDHQAPNQLLLLLVEGFRVLLSPDLQSVGDDPRTSRLFLVAERVLVLHLVFNLLRRALVRLMTMR